MTSPVLTIRGLTKTIRLRGGEELHILRGVDFDLAPGETVAVLGRSGAGKSTLLQIMGLLDPFDQGTYLIEGRDVTRLTERTRSRMRGATFGFVFQQYHLLERRSALANVTAPLLHAPLREFAHRNKKARQALEDVGLSERLAFTPEELSGGEQQRAAIARALIRSPRVLLADEPTGSLDVETGARVLDLLVAAASQGGASLVVITHDTAVAARMHRTVILEDGLLTIRPEDQ
jgi:putative ABC transport system ATP-binding protein